MYQTSNLEIIFPWLCICVFFSIIGLSIYFDYKKKERIKKELKRYALSNNYKFIESCSQFGSLTEFLGTIIRQNNNQKSEENPELNDFSSLLQNFSIFSQGYTQNIIIKQEERCITYWGDHIYSTGSGKSRHTHYCSFVIIRCDKLDIPSFFVRDENAIFDYLGKLFGGQDINFDGDNDFSPKFVLQGNSEEEIRKLFTPKIRRAFASYFAREGYNIYGICGALLIHKEKRLETIGDRLNVERKAKGIFNAIYSECTKNNNDELI